MPTLKAWLTGLEVEMAVGYEEASALHAARLSAVLAHAPKLHLLPIRSGGQSQAAVDIRSSSMNSSTEDNIKGNAKKAKGTVKEKTGELVGNKDLEARGKAEKTEGKVQDKIGDVKNVFGK